MIELMIVIAIIGILAATAVPQYAAYTKRAKFSEVIQATAGFKKAVGNCVQDSNTLTGCSGGARHIPANIGVPQGYVASVTVTDGLITATGIAEVDNATFILTPSYAAATSTLSWSISGTCLTIQLCRN